MDDQEIILNDWRGKPLTSFVSPVVLPLLFERLNSQLKKLQALGLVHTDVCIGQDLSLATKQAELVDDLLCDRIAEILKAFEEPHIPQLVDELSLLISQTPRSTVARLCQALQAGLEYPVLRYKHLSAVATNAAEVIEKCGVGSLAFTYVMNPLAVLTGFHSAGFVDVEEIDPPEEGWAASLVNATPQLQIYELGRPASRLGRLLMDIDTKKQNGQSLEQAIVQLQDSVSELVAEFNQITWPEALQDVLVSLGGQQVETPSLKHQVCFGGRPSRDGIGRTSY